MNYQNNIQKSTIKRLPHNNGQSYRVWSQLFLNDDLKKIIKQLQFDYPSEVQAKAIPYALQGRDIICQSKSGTGKTMVFLISILQSLVKDKNGEYLHSQALILANTRELSHQICKEFIRMSTYFKRPPLNISCFFGGLSIEQNFKQLKDPLRTPHIVIGTPGRLLDLMIRGLLSFANCKFLVIDQCDKMMENQSMYDLVRQILNKIPLKKQTMMFSATLNSKKQKIYQQYLIDPISIMIDQSNQVLQGMTQFYTRLNEDKKFDKLILLLDILAFNQVIIFTNRVERAKNLTNLLKIKLFNPICVHSALRQEERIKNYDLFKCNGSRLLVTTDLFERGIDIQRVNLVINYDFPQTVETYLHRIGRAGRFNTKGLAINFITYGNDEKTLNSIQKGLKLKIEQLPNEFDPYKYM